MQPGVLLYMTKLLEATVTIGTFVRFLAGMDPDMLDQLVVAAERFQALLTLMGFHFGPASQFSTDVHLHRRFVHEDLQQEEKRTCRIGGFIGRAVLGECVLCLLMLVVLTYI